MTPEDIQLVVALCKARAGLKIDATKTYLMESRLAPLARREGYNSIEELIAGLKQRREEPLIWALVEAMTLNDTSFFRDKALFAQLRDEILPTLSRMRGPEPIRLWSAACATGQEAYSLAILAEEAEGLEAGARIEIYGSDISERCLEKAQAGVYTSFEVQRGLPIRQLVRHITLAAALTAVGRFDVILCRNVLGSLDESIRRRVLESLAAALPADGFMLIEPEASPQDLTDAFRPISGRPGLFARNPSYRVAA